MRGVSGVRGMRVRRGVRVRVGMCVRVRGGCVRGEQRSLAGRARRRGVTQAERRRLCGTQTPALLRTRVTYRHEVALVHTMNY